MQTEKLIEVGYAVRTHGVKGQIKISFSENLKELSQKDALFLLLKENKIPFFISSVEYINDTDVFIVFEGIESKEDAELFTKKPVWALKDYITAEKTGIKSEQAFFGYKVQDKNTGEIGKVINVFDAQEYNLAEVEHKGKNILIPLHKNILIQTDKKKKILYVDLPEGLTDL